jgi:hypothetical protein
VSITIGGHLFAGLGGQAGISVELMTNGAVLASTLTNRNGQYIFNQQISGTRSGYYDVILVLPSWLQQTVAVRTVTGMIFGVEFHTGSWLLDVWFDVLSLVDSNEISAYAATHQG